MGGTNHTDNLIKLSAREHFIAHWMLWKSFRNVKTARAFNMMRNTPGKEYRYINSKAYENFKVEYSIILSKYFSGKNHPNYGKMLKEETKSKISQKLKSHKRTKASIDKQVETRLKNKKSSGMLGKTHSNKFKKDHSARMLGKNNPMYGSKRMWVNDGITNFLIFGTSIPEGMARGRLKWQK